jgi:carbamoyl-phosphate synthase/aspartate carbamoyltransferase/dihydroorotase
VTCEVTPHHMFLTNQDIPAIGAGKSEVRPRLASPSDQQALWDNLEYIDCFATDHAPHTLEEKTGENPPPGFPGLETALPLFLNAIHEGRLSLEDVIKRMYTRPKEIFSIPDQPESWIEVETDQPWEIRAADTFTRCGWTPFEGMQVRGRVSRVVLRSQEAYSNSRLLAMPGTGRNIRSLSV